LGGLPWLMRECSFILYDSTLAKKKKGTETPLYLSFLKKRSESLGKMKNFVKIKGSDDVE